VSKVCLFELYGYFYSLIILFSFSNELLKTYTPWQKVKEEGEFLSFRHVGFFIL